MAKLTDKQIKKMNSIAIKPRDKNNRKILPGHRAFVSPKATGLSNGKLNELKKKRDE